MQLREIMTAGVVTADEGEEVRAVARLMRDRSVGSVVICDPEGAPAAMITDRDVAVRVAADDRSLGEAAGEHASRPLISGRTTSITSRSIVPGCASATASAAVPPSASSTR